MRARERESMAPVVTFSPEQLQPRQEPSGAEPSLSPRVREIAHSLIAGLPLSGHNSYHTTKPSVSLASFQTGRYVRCMRDDMLVCYRRDLSGGEWRGGVSLQALFFFLPLFSCLTHSPPLQCLSVPNFFSCTRAAPPWLSRPVPARPHPLPAPAPARASPKKRTGKKTTRAPPSRSTVT